MGLFLGAPVVVRYLFSHAPGFLLSYIIVESISPENGMIFTDVVLNLHIPTAWSLWLCRFLLFCWHRHTAASLV